jgi:hypothetical protein
VQHSVRLGAAVRRDDVDRHVDADFAVNRPDDVEQLRIHLGRLVRSPIPQEPVQLLERRLVVCPVSPECNRGAFLRMRVEHRQGPRIAVRDRVLRCRSRQDETEDPCREGQGGTENFMRREGSPT